MRTRNFTLAEIAHRPLPKDLEPIGLVLLGYAQCMRDAACARFSRNIAIDTTSGYRDRAYNRTVSTATNPDNSNHIWRYINGVPVAAWDFSPIGFNIITFWDWFKNNSTGERYLNIPRNFIHWAPNAPDKSPWVVR